MKKSYESPNCKIVVTTTDFDLLQISAEKGDPTHGGEDNRVSPKTQLQVYTLKHTIS